MAIFNKADPRPSRSDGTMLAPEGALSVIGTGMRIVGDVESTGVIKIEGVVEGGVRSSRQILLGKTGVIQGDVHAADAVLGGKVVGSVIASERVEIQNAAIVEGDIYTRSIVVAEGGSINGQVRMGEQLEGHSPVRQSDA